MDEDWDNDDPPRRLRVPGWVCIWLIAGIAPLTMTTLDLRARAGEVDNRTEATVPGIEVRITRNDPRAQMTWCQLIGPGPGGLDLGGINLDDTFAANGVNMTRPPCNQRVGVRDRRPLIVVPNLTGGGVCSCEVDR